MLQAHIALRGRRERSTLASLRTGSTGPQALAAQPLPLPFAAHTPCSNSPSLRDPWTFSCSRTHLEPGHSASPGPALSCGKICSWTQNHTALQQKPRSSMRAAHATSSLVNVHANPRSNTPACQTRRPKPCTPSKQTHMPGLCGTALGWLTKELLGLRQLFLPLKNSPVCRNFRQGFLVCSSCRIAAASRGDKIG